MIKKRVFKRMICRNVYSQFTKEADAFYCGAALPFRISNSKLAWTSVAVSSHPVGAEADGSWKRFLGNYIPMCWVWNFIPRYETTQLGVKLTTQVKTSV
jgi:hypothetical protein